MNKLSKRLRAFIAIAIMLSVALPTLAHNFAVDGIYYNYIDKTAKTVEVTYRGSSSYDFSNEYTGAIIIPSSITYNGTTYSVTEIRGWAFQDCTGLTSITIPNSVVKIGNGAFDGCSNLVSVIAGNSLTSIGNEAFYDCTKLTSITIPNSVTEIGSSAFVNCIGLASVTIGNSVTTIGEKAFYKCLNIKLVINLSNLILNKGFLSNGYVAYYADRVINAPNGAIEGDFVWAQTDNVNILAAYLGNANELTLPADFNGDNYVIGDSIFSGYSNLTSISIPNSVILIGQYAFYNCTGLQSLNFPSSITSIGNYSFYNCINLTTISIPNSLTSIGNFAFSECTNLTSVFLGNSILSIGANAFSGCDNLLDIRSFNPMPQKIDTNAFSSTTYTNATLTVPYKCNRLYANLTGWENFSNIIEILTHLTIKLPESGIITLKEAYEETVELSFKANDGWQINTVSFNEDDVTSQLDDDGNYTTPVLTEDATLIVVFEKIPTGVEPLTLTNDIKVYVKDGFVEIVGANAESVVNIYDTMGISKYIGKDNSIYLEDSGIYILTVEGRTFKFAM